MELKLGTKCALFGDLKSKDSGLGILGKIIGYAGEHSFRFKFSTPHGTIIETGMLWLRQLTDGEKIQLEGYEIHALEQNGSLYDEGVVY